MKRTVQTIFLQAVVLCSALGVASFLLVEPWSEGINAHATSWRDVYLDDPFLWFVYLGAVPFFVALFNIFKILGILRRGESSKDLIIKSSQTIKQCAKVTIGFVIAGQIYIMLTHGSDDPAGALMLGNFIILVSLVVIAVVGVREG